MAPDLSICETVAIVYATGLEAVRQPVPAGPIRILESTEGASQLLRIRQAPCKNVGAKNAPI
jgi:hypothetical protein